MVELRELPRERLEDMAAAGAEIMECYRLLQKTNDNVVGEVLRGQGEFYEWDHYPPGDVYDNETHSQYYYHAHPAELRGGEHGHFHTFLRPKGMPAGIAPAQVADFSPPPGDNDALSHLIGISMDSRGYPIRLFTANRWVTGEVWYVAEDVIAMLDCFDMDLAYPSLPVNTWVGAMLRLYRPTIEDLLLSRDQTVDDWKQRHHDVNVYEDRNLELASYVDISVENHFQAVLQALEAK